jgi:ABC-type cobalamin/Fe3+-siderophores transport system ATPase subunit
MLAIDKPNMLLLDEPTNHLDMECIDALAEVTVRVEDKTTKRIFYGRSANNDVIAASAQAYLNALNRALANRKTGVRTHSHSSPSS